MAPHATGPTVAQEQPGEARSEALTWSGEVGCLDGEESTCLVEPEDGPSDAAPGIGSHHQLSPHRVNPCGARTQRGGCNFTDRRDLRRRIVAVPGAALLAAILVLAVVSFTHPRFVARSRGEKGDGAQRDVIDRQLLPSHCWLPCKGRPGPCAWCGQQGSCCRFAADAGTPGCMDVSAWNTKLWATCVRSPLAAAEVGSSRQNPTDDEGTPSLRTVISLQEPEGSLHDPDIDRAQCSIDVSQAIFSLGEAGTAIAAATVVCVDPNNRTYHETSKERTRRQATCTVAVTSIVAAFMYSAAFLADAAANCELGFDPPAACAGDSFWLIASLSELAKSATALSQACTNEASEMRSPAPIAYDSLRKRRLGALPCDDDLLTLPIPFIQTGQPEDVLNHYVLNPNEQDGINIARLSQAQCAFDTMQASAYLARAGVEIDRAVKDCVSDGSTGCAVDIEFTINAFLFTGKFISDAVTSCPGAIVNTAPICAASVMSLLGSLAGVGAAATDFRRACQGGPAPAPWPPSFNPDAPAPWPPSFIPEPPVVPPYTEPPPVVPPYTPAPKPEPLGPLLTFEVYRAQSDSEYQLQDTNAANLAGILWYLQHEVVAKVPNTSAGQSILGNLKIVRYNVKYRPPGTLAQAGMNFGVRFAYSNGQCTGPGNCDKKYMQYGNFVGCNNLGEYPYPRFETYYPGGVWYSFPGFGECQGTPTGLEGCTYSFKPAGRLRLSELEGSLGLGFWKDGENTAANVVRIEAARVHFARLAGNASNSSFGQMAPDPRCDFDINEFYRDVNATEA